MSKPVNSVHQSETAQSIQNFSLKTSIQQCSQSWSQLKKDIYASQAWKTYQQSRIMLNEQVCKPFSSAWKKVYSQLPSETTKLKFNYLDDYSYKQRLLGLNILAIGSALFTIRGYTWNTAYSKTFKAVRNSTLTYAIAGLLLAPEIYNPLMKPH